MLIAETPPPAPMTSPFFGAGGQRPRGCEVLSAGRKVPPWGQEPAHRAAERRVHPSLLGPGGAALRAGPPTGSPSSRFLGPLFLAELPCVSLAEQGGCQKKRAGSDLCPAEPSRTYLIHSPVPGQQGPFPRRCFKARLADKRCSASISFCREAEESVHPSAHSLDRGY